jgi:hypothetical protein
MYRRSADAGISGDGPARLDVRIHPNVGARPSRGARQLEPASTVVCGVARRARHVTTTAFVRAAGIL